MNRRMCILLFLVLAGTAVPAQEKKLKVYVSADMEGVAGVATWQVQATPQGREYDKFRRIMTEEVNAAIQGAYEAGATEVLVSDSHDSGQNIDIELLDKRARLVRGFPRPYGMMQGIDNTFSAVVFLGYHAGEGQANAVLAHTFTGQLTIKLNGVEVPEAGFNAAIAGEYNVPVVFLSGDQTICEQAKHLLGPIETVVVKESNGFFSATMVNPSLVQTLIRAGVKRGIERRSEITPYKLDRPVKMELNYYDLVKAEVVSYLPWVQHPTGNTIIFSAHDMLEGSRFMQALNGMNRFSH